MNDERVPLSLTLNGERRTFLVRMHDSLLDVLRREGCKSVKRVCETADCGACSVWLAGALVDACSTLALQADGSAVRTLEGLGPGTELHPLQEAFLRHAAVQCGYCIPGMLLSMQAVLESNPKASEAELREVMTLCRCTGYVKPIAATQEHQQRLRRDGGDD